MIQKIIKNIMNEMSLPLDIFRLISLQLNPRSLGVCKSLYHMYDNIWYKDKLQILNPSLKIREYPNYKELYDSYLEQGNVILFNDGNILKFPKCIKATLYNDKIYILNFNGDLYSVNRLINNDVVDIYTNSYIKKYEWYIRRKKVNVTPNSPFIKVLSEYCRTYYALTLNGIYYSDRKHNISFYSLANCTDMYLGFGILYVLTSNGITHSLSSSFPIKETQTNDVKLITNKGLFDKEENPLIVTEPLNNAWKMGKITVADGIYFPSFDNIKKYFTVSYVLVILEKDNMYVYKLGDHIERLLFMSDKVSNIIESDTDFFFITHDDPIFYNMC